MLSHSHCRRALIPLSLALLGILPACGGGGGGGASGASGTTSTLSGVVAVGSPIANASISVKCASGANQASSSSATGTWTVNISGSLPCAVQASGGTINGNANTTAYHSLATSAGTVNVTPLTDLVVANLAGTAPSTWFAGLSANTLSTISTNAVNTALGNVRTALASLTPLASNNPISTSFTATPGNTMDDMLSAIQRAATSAGTSYSGLVNAAALNTLNIDPAAVSVSSNLAANYATVVAANSSATSPAGTYNFYLSDPPMSNCTSPPPRVSGGSVVLSAPYSTALTANITLNLVGAGSVTMAWPGTPLTNTNMHLPTFTSGATTYYYNLDRPWSLSPGALELEIYTANNSTCVETVIFRSPNNQNQNPIAGFYTTQVSLGAVSYNLAAGTALSGPSYFSFTTYIGSLPRLGYPNMSGSFDPDGRLVSATWTSTLGSTQGSTHTRSLTAAEIAAGTMVLDSYAVSVPAGQQGTVTLTVTDDQGATGSITTPIGFAGATGSSGGSGGSTGTPGPVTVSGAFSGSFSGTAPTTTYPSTPTNALALWDTSLVSGNFNVNSMMWTGANYAFPMFDVIFSTPASGSGAYVDLAIIDSSLTYYYAKNSATQLSATECAAGITATVNCASNGITLNRSAGTMTLSNTSFYSDSGAKAVVNGTVGFTPF